ncbi:MAG: flagellar biosynthesis anti-sigma factor FlgM [Gammaproteobacteria bacterium]|nr:flagellar biosynthesis anti-sigma factor FlgM [Gammaproteobacteria bacterium]MDE2250668.1 flagellar biosynthesis anti-sigma factor FlgM [Gammaproteobacteria bacterium]
MTNRIKGSDPSAVDTGTSRTIERLRPAAPAGSATTPTSAAPADSVNITDAARRLAELRDVVANVPEIDAGRVAALSQAIEQGRFAADPHQIANRLLQLERDLAAAGQRRRS